jgi:hypothetical protein
MARYPRSATGTKHILSSVTLRVEWSTAAFMAKRGRTQDGAGL